MNVLVKFLLAAGLLAPGASLLASEDKPRDWLEQMSHSVQSSNYRGTFIFQRADRIDVMQIVHANKDGKEWEKLSSLTGPKREVIRNDQMVTCVLGDKQAVMLNQSQPRQPFPAGFPEDLRSIEKHYSFEFAGYDRVAGIDCRLIAIMPRDHYRYGQRLCIANDNKVLLRAELTSDKGEFIEQVMFTQIDFPKFIGEKEFRSEYQGKSYRWVREPGLSLQGEAQQTPSKNWRFAQIPEGFMQTNHAWHDLSEQNPSVEHWVFSDGLASVSVYIEQAESQDEFYTGVSKRGALNAFGTMVQGYYVTAVGEVPIETLETIGKSVKYQP